MDNTSGFKTCALEEDGHTEFDYYDWTHEQRMFTQLPAESTRAARF